MHFELLPNILSKSQIVSKNKIKTNKILNFIFSDIEKIMKKPMYLILFLWDFFIS